MMFLSMVGYCLLINQLKRHLQVLTTTQLPLRSPGSEGTAGEVFLFGILLAFSLPAFSASTTASFKVRAEIKKGCEFGEGGNFGTVNFGTMSAIRRNVDIASIRGAGSISVTCTPGIAINLALDYGQNGGNAHVRFLKSGNNLLGYQLYQDAARSVVWGEGKQSYFVSSFPENTQNYTIYGRLFAVKGMPSAGTYTDTVTVTLSY